MCMVHGVLNKTTASHHSLVALLFLFLLLFLSSAKLQVLYSISQSAFPKPRTDAFRVLSTVVVLGISGINLPATQLIPKLKQELVSISPIQKDFFYISSRNQILQLAKQSQLY